MFCDSCHPTAISHSLLLQMDESNVTCVTLIIAVVIVKENTNQVRVLEGDDGGIYKSTIVSPSCAL